MHETDCLDLVDLCYRAVEDPAAWGSFVERLTRVLGADAADFTVENYVNGSSNPFGTVGFDPTFRVEYDVKFLGENPWIEALMRLPALRSFSDDLEPDDFEASAYYNEWVRPQGLRHAIGALIDHDARRAIHIGVLRKRGRQRFSPEHARFLDQVLPHIRRGLWLCDRLHAAGGGQGAVDALIEQFRLPAFLIGPGRRLFGLNPAAEAVLRDGGDLSVSRGRLSVWEPGAVRALEAALDAACGLEGLLNVPGRAEIAIPRRRDDGPPLVADLIPLRPADRLLADGPCCLLLLTDPGARLPEAPGLLARLWGLTPAEAALALALADGVTLAEHAEQAGTSIGTARWHLKNVESKIGVNSMTAVAARIQGALRRA